MLSSPSARSNADLGFFSNAKGTKTGASATSSVVVTTRLTRRPVAQPRSSSSTSCQSLLPSSSPTSSITSSPLSSPPTSPRKRKSPTNSVAGPSALPREVKRLRTASAREPPVKRKSNPSSKASSRAASRQRTLPPSPEPIYRSSRSRSTSLFPAPEPEIPANRRRWRTPEQGFPGDTHLSSEMVVKRLMKSYKSYFKNLDDLTDESFAPHPTNYPVVELEYPNTGASER
ncbi:hypothetical protein B0H34DRAFT_57428 [Crassisporium funariophilum]|nr:hypothetical protein B0H34DRAFT_57428 [Crassisporium funariophilum]